MSTMMCVAIAVAISVAIGTLLYVALAGPLRSLLQNACPSINEVRFWQRFTLIMLYLLPVLLSLVFAVPSAERIAKVTLESVLLRAIITSLIGAFIVMLGMGRWIRTLAERAEPQLRSSEAQRQSELPRGSAE